jgi:ribosomal protein L7Ae-like RNA K-turn-binding protein
MERNSKYNCALTGKSNNIKQMLLFKEMNNILMCDVNAKLSEKGLWCNPNRYDIEKAIKQKVFDKLLNKKLKIPSFFIEGIENNLRLKVLNLIGLSKKAGLLEIGLDKVTKALNRDLIDIVLIAKEDKKFNSFILKKIDENNILFNKNFSREEIGRAIGYKKVLCIALKVSKLSNALRLDIYKLNKFNMG